MPPKTLSTVSTRVFWLASRLFFISGATGLAYQVVWFKRFSHVWGSTSLAFAAVGGSFLFGLGLGAYLFGRFADGARRPLRWYGVCELLIGGLALVIPFEIAALVEASVGLYSHIPEQPLLRFLVQFCVTVLVIGPPCVLMGGTLPLLIRELTARDGSLDQATGWLYAINTFGAAGGCYLTGFYLLPWLGLLWTNNLTATVNIALGAISIAASRRAVASEPARPAAPLPEAALKGPWSLALAGLYVATIFSGCAALVLEMTWTRQLALILGGSTYAFTATLCVVLVGIALGSLIFHLLLRRVASSALVPAVVVGVLLAGTLIGTLALPTLSLVVASQSVRALRGDAFWNAFYCVTVSAVLEFLPAVAMGVLFPLFVHLTRASAARVGAAVGNIYAWNTLGSILGASLTAVLLFPWIGTAGAVAFSAGLYVVAAMMVMPWRGERHLALLGAVAVMGLGAVIVLAHPTDPRLTNMGFYIYGDPALKYPGKDIGPKWMETIEPLYFCEGASSDVFVAREAGTVTSLRVNGKVDATDAGDMVTQVGLAYFPRMFKHDAKEVLVIGFGSGCTSGRSLLFPDTRVTCCEIEPAVYAAAEYFADASYAPHRKSRAWLEAHHAELPASERLSPQQIDSQARFSMIFGDGRTAIQGGDKKYHLIISEPSNPWLAGVSNLFTQEFFRAAREHLSDDGVLAQWIQTYNFTLSDYLMIVRTLSSEFEHFGVITLLGGADTVLLASRKPLMPDAKNLEALQKVVDGVPEIAKDLKTWYGGADLRLILAQHYQLGEEQLRAVVAQDSSQALNTDLHLRLEFDAPLHLFRQLSASEAASTALAAAIGPQWTETLAARLGLDYNSTDYHVALGRHLENEIDNPRLHVELAKAGQLDRASAEYEQALRIDETCMPAHRGLARVRMTQQRHVESAVAYEAAVKLAPDDAILHAGLAQELLIIKQAARAADHFRQALRLKPQLSRESGNYLWANNLAWILATSSDPRLRNGAEAVHWAKQACEFGEYKQTDFLETLATAYAEVGQFDEAIKVSEQMIRLSPGDAQLVNTTRDRIKLYQASQPFREN